MKVYIAGPMTGIDEYNFPAFFEAEEYLEALGFETVNPARLDAVTAEEIEGPGGLGEGSMLPAYLRRDFRELVECDGIVLLDGWRWSPGANAELAVARWLGFKAWHLRKYPSGLLELEPAAALPNVVIINETWQRFTLPIWREQKREDKEQCA